MRAKKEKLRNNLRSESKSCAVPTSGIVGPILISTILALVAGIFLSCSSGKYSYHPDNIYWRDDDKQNIPEPEKIDMLSLILSRSKAPSSFRERKRR